MRLSHQAPSHETEPFAPGDRPANAAGLKGEAGAQSRRSLVALAHELVCLASEIEARAVAREIRPAAFFDPGHLLVEPGNEQKLVPAGEAGHFASSVYAIRGDNFVDEKQVTVLRGEQVERPVRDGKAVHIPIAYTIERGAAQHARRGRERISLPKLAEGCARRLPGRSPSALAWLIGIAHRHKSIVEATGGVGVRVQQFRLPLDLIARKPAVVAVQQADIAARARLAEPATPVRSTSDYAEKVTFGFDCPSQPPNGRFLASRRSKRLR